MQLVRLEYLPAETKVSMAEFRQKKEAGCKFATLRLALLLAGVLCQALPSHAEPTSRLLNGRDLTGWSGDPKIWSVADGQIVGTTVGNKITQNTFLVWEGGQVEDFRLTFMARVEGKNNSGVQYRSELVDPKTWRAIGYQIDIHPKPEYTAMLYSEGTGRGIMAQRGQRVIADAKTGKTSVVGKTSQPAPTDISGWHEYSIIARGNRLIHKIDGKTTIDITDDYEKRRKRGVIALQIHNGPPMTAYFKDIVLETLTGNVKEKPKSRAAQAGSNLSAKIQVAPGFQVERLFDVPKSMGSWVSLTADTRGNLFASDQGGAGIFKIVPGRIGTREPPKVEKLPVKLSGAQGLVWAFDSLYAMVHTKSDSGLHRLTDSDKDGELDTDEHLMPLAGIGEHGPHALALSPDGESIYVACGNHTDLPADLAGSRIPTNWGEDHLLPRRWDPRGHATGRLAPGGWICQVDPTGKEWKVVSVGYRNQYDMAFNADGELFSYDADMEWDLGLPWYRPTRLLHATSGSEFGWRAGTGKWPDYYEDSLPAALEIGPGSPTGVVFGYGTSFPAKYQKALYLLDWTFGTIYAVHLTPDGSTYRGKKEEFITGVPLAVTDAAVSQDGALYFTIGGRGTESALYRVTYSGDESVAQVPYEEKAGAELRSLRHQLEAMHGSDAGDLDVIFANLAHRDRFIRYAARIALESQPVDHWRERALSALPPQAAISAVVALARQGQSTDASLALESLDRMDWTQLSEPQQLALLRAYSLVFIRLGEPNEPTRQRLIARWDSLYPAATSSTMNLELVQLLVYLRAPSVIEKTLDLMEQLGPDPVPDWAELAKRSDYYGGTIQKMLSSMPPSRAVHCAFVLRNRKSGWTLQQRRRYFNFFLQAASQSGGASYARFLTEIRDDALADCSPAERVLLEPITSQSLTTKPIAATPPTGPGQKWTKAAALEVLAEGFAERSQDAGRNLFHAISCAKCHRLNGEGGAIGPDLSTVVRKYSLVDLVDAILDPNKVISDQYQSHLVLTSGGLTVTGRAIEIGDQIHVYTDDADAPPKVIERADIEEMSVSKISQMPSNLIDTLNPEELKDLVAYLMSFDSK